MRINAIYALLEKYESVPSPYENMTDMAYNARRFGTMAAKELGLNSDGQRVAINIYIVDILRRNNATQTKQTT